MTEPADRINAAALLLARGLPSQAAVAGPDGSADYAALRSQVAQAAGAWHDFGVEPGEVVLLRLPPGLERSVAFLGAIWAGAVPVPLGEGDEGHRGDPWDAHAPARFILAASRAGYASAWRDSVLTRLEWRAGLGAAGAAEPVALPPQAPCCWTEPRRRGGDGARLLRHAFAQLQPREVPSAGGEPVEAPTMLALLRALRRGASAVIGDAAGAGSAPRRTAPAEALALP
ncbi:AMP-binding protein [Ramlibacter tataouinensis]|uniref:AMP-binding protein n=1 Tax=Ramlibacter tataouinensis TaxID=94132 RepID=UPI0022F3A7A9|nr:AMP-binding protein [Ramlibacter tataouinensis]WBY03225.1 AMP-binding protein [Ramlibacter tataouinensis]